MYQLFYNSVSTAVKRVGHSNYELENIYIIEQHIEEIIYIILNDMYIHDIFHTERN